MPQKHSSKLYSEVYWIRLHKTSVWHLFLKWRGKKHFETRLCIIFQEFSNFLERLNLLQLWNNRVRAHFEWLQDWVTASTGASGDFIVVNSSFCSVPTFISYFYTQKKKVVLNTVFIAISNSQFVSGFTVAACIEIHRTISLLLLLHCKMLSILQSWLSNRRQLKTSALKSAKADTAITNMCCYTSCGSSPHGAAVVLAKENAGPRETNLIQLGWLPLKKKKVL